MNERIRKIESRAWGQVPRTNGLVRTEDFNEKFAELIVKECMEQVWYSREDGINGNVSEVIKDRIKEHFGVKE